MGRLLWFDSDLPCSASKNSTVKEGVVLTPSVQDASVAELPRSEFQLHGKNPGDKAARELCTVLYTAGIQETSLQVKLCTAAQPTVPYTARIQRQVCWWSCLLVELPTVPYMVLYTVPYTARIFQQSRAWQLRTWCRTWRESRFFFKWSRAQQLHPRCRAQQLRPRCRTWRESMRQAFQWSRAQQPLPWSSGAVHSSPFHGTVHGGSSFPRKGNLIHSQPTVHSALHGTVHGQTSR